MYYVQGSTYHERENALGAGYVPVLSKFATYISAIPDKDWVKKNVAPQKVAGIDKEFKCEKIIP